MLDYDLAELYGVETKQLKRQVKRNMRRFPSDFMIEISERDMKSLRCQFGTSNRGGDRYGAYAFTEQGIAMLSSILRSERAIDVNIRIMRAFVAMRRFVSDHAGLVQRVGAIELKQFETDKRIDTVFDALDRGNLLPSGILPAESEFDSMRYVSRLIESAKSEIVLIDPYSDAVTLEVLSKKRPGVKVRLVCKDRGKPTPTEIAKFNRQYKGLSVTYSDNFHDRFLVIDNIELHGLGSSINCLGRRVASYTTRDAKEIAKLLAMMP
ncbi:MAG: ORF6N domain-containing protein [Kiritimatiellae bacterium]|nr:ORF6N domain-containing protein [Kiritimatiellia bacterium]